ncbi:MAG TPA: glycerol kinase, partial [Spirochaetia bacterium]|nr:glycerol kinase [Spirochaetia bacterium]
IEINAVTMRETTALGAAFLAGLATGYYENIDYLKGLNKAVSVYKPSINSAQSKLLMKRWQKAVEAVRLFGSGDI